MKHINTWYPDTCGCELHFEWDDELPIEQRVHTPVEHFIDSSGKHRKHNMCGNHSGITDIHELHKHVTGENTSKNLFLGHILENHPRLVDTKDDGGGEYKKLKPHIQYQYSFTGKDHEREIHVRLVGEELTPEERASLQDHGSKLAKQVHLL